MQHIDQDHGIVVEIDDQFIFLGMSVDSIVFGDVDGDTIKLVVKDKNAGLELLKDIQQSIIKFNDIWGEQDERRKDCGDGVSAYS